MFKEAYNKLAAEQAGTGAAAADYMQQKTQATQRTTAQQGGQEQKQHAAQDVLYAMTTRYGSCA